MVIWMAMPEKFRTRQGSIWPAQLLCERLASILKFGTLLFVCLFDLILYVPSTIFQLNRDGSSWVEPVLS